LARKAHPHGWRYFVRLQLTKELIAVLLLALAGFLIGGVYATWKSARALAMGVAVAAVLAIVGAIAWLSG
jgi:hypothetical protein